MSRSNPIENLPHPCVRWFEWDGSRGELKYYDKEKKENVHVEAQDFGFVLLDRLATVKGWHDDSESGIFSNEVKDTRNDPLVVKAFKVKQVLAEGFYSQIRDRIKALGGHFVTMLYVTFKDGDSIKLGSLALKGAALRQWMEFENANRADIYKQAITISEIKDGNKGGVRFKMPVFKIMPVSNEINDIATEFDSDLQTYFRAYFSRTRVEQAQPTPVNGEESANQELAGVGATKADEDEIPF